MVLNCFVVPPIRFLIFKNKRAASRECIGNAQIYAEIRWEMRLKALGRPFEQYLKGIGNTLGNVKQKWRPDGCIPL
jgi:hypothetical protein